MGVPGFFIYLLKNFNKLNFIYKNIETKIDRFYIDANCFFHPQSLKIAEYYKNNEKLEQLIIQRIINYLDYIIKFVNPIKEVFISVDGVAPMAKINQQRKRRFKSVYDNNIKNKLKQQFDQPIENLWSNCNITPGTIFMEKLHEKITEYIHNNQSGLKIIYTYSSYHTIGEGEHKIMQDIKQKNKIYKDEIYVIYGLDCDLIFLSLACNKNNIYLLREESFLDDNLNNSEDLNMLNDIKENYNYISIDNIKININNGIIENIKKMNISDLELNNIDFIKDFIVICYFIGNDFLPNIPSINIKNNGINFLIKVYIDTYIYLRYNLVKHNNKINNKFIINYIYNLSKGENYYFTNKYPEYLEKRNQQKCPYDDPYKCSIWELENMKNTKLNDPIKLGKDEPKLWKFRYYEYYYKVTQYQYEHIQNMCSEYLKGIIWITEYYFNECPSWDWNYIFYNAPFVSDISYFLGQNKDYISRIKFKKSNSITPLIQLLSVIPPQYFDMLPLSYKNIIQNNFMIKDLFPEQIFVDQLYKDNFYKCIAFTPNINIERIKDFIKNLELTEYEQEMNRLYNNIIVYKNNN